MTDDKQLKIEGLKKNLANTEKEYKELIPQFLESQTKKREFLVRMRDVETKLHEIAIKNFVALKHDWEFQKNPEWNALQLEKSKLDFQHRQMEHEATLKTVDRNIESQKAQIESLKKSAEDLQAQIDALEATE